MRRIAALVPNVLGAAPGQRVRIESWAKHLRHSDWSVDFYPFEDERLHEVLYKSGRCLDKVTRVLSCYLRQLRLLLEGPPCDVLFIYREAALIGPALLERLASRLGVPVVYDLDDPVFLPYRSPRNGWLSLLKFPRKTYSVLRMSDHVIAINRIIANYVVYYNPSVSVIPNCIDTERYLPDPMPSDDTVRLVWIGSHSTMSNLEAIAQPLRRIQSMHRVALRVIGAGAVELPGVRVEAKRWSADTEVADLQQCHIGLVPLANNPWNQWKFFYKTVQYMAIGIPVIAQKMGSLSEVIQDGVNGFLVETEDEWYDRLCALVQDRAMRQQMGAAARTTVVKQYSTHVHMPAMVSVFERVRNGRKGVK